jgi:hypothetical protein
MEIPRLFKTAKPVIGMLHILPLPGSPGYSSTPAAIRDFVLRDADVLSSNGVDGLILENFGDTPFYPSRVPPHTVAFMTAVACEVKARFPVPLGMNVLRNDALSALAIAAAVNGDFIRVNVYTGARLTDQGIIQGQAHRVLRYRKLLESGVLVFADAAVKHSAPLADRDFRDEVEDTVSRGHPDAIIVTGRGTGKETSIDDLRTAKEAAGKAAVLAGSGVTIENIREVLAHADGLIVGTALNEDGVVSSPIDSTRVRRFVEATARARVA